MQRIGVDERRRQHLASLNRPNSSCFVLGCRGQALPRTIEHEPENVVSMLERFSQRTPRRCIPNVDGATRGTRGDHLSIRAKLDGCFVDADYCTDVLPFQLLLSRFDIPHSDKSVLRGGDQLCSLRTEACPVRYGQTRKRSADRLTRRCIPDLRFSAVATWSRSHSLGRCGQTPAVRRKLGIINNAALW